MHDICVFIKHGRLFEPIFYSLFLLIDFCNYRTDDEEFRLRYERYQWIFAWSPNVRFGRNFASASFLSTPFFDFVSFFLFALL